MRFILQLCRPGLGNSLREKTPNLAWSSFNKTRKHKRSITMTWLNSYRLLSISFFWPVSLPTRVVRFWGHFSAMSNAGIALLSRRPIWWRSRIHQPASAQIDRRELRIQMMRMTMPFYLQHEKYSLLILAELNLSHSILQKYRLIMQFWRALTYSFRIIEIYQIYDR